MISRRTMIAGSVATVATAYSCSLEALAANQSSSKTRKFTMDLRGSSTVSYTHLTLPTTPYV